MARTVSTTSEDVRQARELQQAHCAPNQMDDHTLSHWRQIQQPPSNPGTENNSSCSVWSTLLGCHHWTCRHRANGASHVHVQGDEAQHTPSRSERETKHQRIDVTGWLEFFAGRYAVQYGAEESLQPSTCIRCGLRDSSVPTKTDRRHCVTKDAVASVSCARETPSTYGMCRTDPCETTARPTHGTREVRPGVDRRAFPGVSRVHVF